MVGRGDVGVFSIAGRCRACFPEDALCRRFVSLCTVRCFGDCSNRGVPHRRGVSTRKAHRDIRGQRLDRYVRRFCSWRHRIEGCTVRLWAVLPEVSRFSRSSVLLGQRGCVWGRFAVVSSFRGQRGSVWGKSQTVHRPKGAVRGTRKGRCGAFFEEVKARFTKSQFKRL